MTKRTTRSAVVAGLVASGRGCSLRAAAAARATRQPTTETTAASAHQGRPDHRPRPAQRQRLQRARLQRPQAGREGARSPGSCRRVEVGRRLRAEHDDARAPGLRPDHRGRIRAGRSDRHGGEGVPEHEVRDRRRRPGVAEGQAGERRGAPVPRGAGRLPRRLPRRARGEARGRQGDQRRRRLQGAARRPVHRGLQGGRDGGRRRAWP